MVKFPIGAVVTTRSKRRPMLTVVAVHKEDNGTVVVEYPNDRYRWLYRIDRYWVEVCRRYYTAFERKPGMDYTVMSAKSLRILSHNKQSISYALVGMAK